MNIKLLITEKINSNELFRRIYNGAFWSIFGTASSKILVLIAGIICARILGKEQYGELGMIRSTISLFVVLGASGLGLTGSKYISEYRKQNNHLLEDIYGLTTGFAIFIAILITLISFFLSHYICSNILEAPQLTFEFKLGGLILFVTILNGAQNGILTGFESFKEIAINNFWTSIAETIFLIIGCYLYGVTGAILGYGLSYIILWALNHYTLRSVFKKYNKKMSLRINWRLFNILYKFSLPATISALLVTPVFWGIRAMLIHYNGFSESAVYDVADQWKIIILFIPSSIAQIVLPILSSAKSSSTETHDFWKVLKINLWLNIGICFFISIVVIIFSSFIMKLYGNGFTNNIPLILLSISTIFSSASAVIGMCIASLGKMWTGCMFNIIWGACVLVIGNILLQNAFGVDGVCISILSSYLIITLIQAFYIWYLKRNYSFI